MYVHPYSKYLLFNYAEAPPSKLKAERILGSWALNMYTK